MADDFRNGLAPPPLDSTWPPPDWVDVPEPVEPVAPVAPIDPGTDYLSSFEDEFQRAMGGPEMPQEPPPEPVEPPPDWGGALEGRGLAPLEAEPPWDALNADLEFDPFSQPVGPTTGPSLGVEQVTPPPAALYSAPPSEMVEAAPGEEGIGYNDLNEEARAQRDIANEHERQRYLGERQAELEHEEAKRQEGKARQFAKARERANAEGKRILGEIREVGEQRLDRDRWWESRSGGQKAAAIASAAMGGFLRVMGHGRNTALDMISESIQQDLEMQKADMAQQMGSLQQQKGLLGELYARIGDQEAAEQAFHAVRLKQIEDAMEEEARQYDPQGTLAREQANARAQVAARRAQAEAAAEDKAYSRTMEIEELDIKKQEQMRKQAETAMNMRETQAKIDKLNRRGGGKNRKPPEYFEALYGADGRPPVPMTDKEHASWLSTRKKVGDLAPETPSAKDQAELAKTQAEAEAAEREIAADDTAIRSPNTGKPFILKNGKPWRTGAAQEVSNRMQLAQNIQSKVDKILAIRDRAGGSWDALKSDDWQEVNSLVRGADFENAVALGLGALSEGDLRELVNYRGGVDPTSQIFNAAKGLETMAEQTTDKANLLMRANGWDGERWEPVATARSKARKMSNDEIIGDLGNTMSFRIKRKSGLSAEDAQMAVYEDRKQQIDTLLRRNLTPEQMEQALDELRKLSKVEDGLAPEQVQALGSMMRSEYVRSVQERSALKQVENNPWSLSGEFVGAGGASSEAAAEAFQKKLEGN